jgi:Kef-type K+ transport system membrane component KefB
MVAAAMNARGAVEVLLATAARQAGLIDDRLFVALVAMALGTSVLAAVALARLLHPAPRPGSLASPGYLRPPAAARRANSPG